MSDGPNIARVASLFGDPARAEVMVALATDRALTATELATLAGVTKQTMSAHLTKLVEARLIQVEPQGRHRYFRIASRDVAQLIEQLMGVAFRTGAVHLRASPREPALRKARVCYDHLAGELGVLALEGLVSRGVLQQDTSGIRPGPSSAPWFSSLGIDVASLSMSRRLLCRPCLDWSERRHHLAGSLGAALLRRLFELKWARCANDSRVVLFSASGEREFRARFGPAAH